MNKEQIIEMNKGRYEFRKEATSTKYKGYRKTPGHVLVEEFMVPAYPAQLSHLANRTGIPYKRLMNLIRGKDRIDDKMANSLGTFFANGAQYWLDLQEAYERGEQL